MDYITFALTVTGGVAVTAWSARAALRQVVKLIKKWMKARMKLKLLNAASKATQVDKCV